MNALGISPVSPLCPEAFFNKMASFWPFVRFLPLVRKILSDVPVTQDTVQEIEKARLRRWLPDASAAHTRSWNDF